MYTNLYLISTFNVRNDKLTAYLALFGKSGSRKFACLDLYSFSTNFSIWKLWIQVKYFTSPGISVQCLDPLYPKSA